MPRSPSFPFRTKHRPLAASLTALCCASANVVHATAFVTNCNDAGAGSLRAAALSAASGDTVDASALLGVCSTITLTTGSIPVGQTNLKFVGPGKDNLAVTVGPAGTTRLFTHTGNGALEIDDMSLTKGYANNPSGIASGGCIHSNGNVVLKRANVVFCEAHSANVAAVGGGVYAQGSIYLRGSLVSGNAANGGAGGGATGGGLCAQGGVTAKYSTISSNTATNDANDRGAGGGIYVHGSGILVRSTTISGNTAGQYAGGLLAIVTGTATVFNSTISGNRALHGVTGGGYVSANAFTLYNSTIAANLAYTGTFNLPAGLAVRGTGTSPSMKMESTLIANNTYSMTPTNNDFFNSGFTITGHNNLIRTSSSGLPADTIVGQCPLLGPLKSNGGPTKTHALSSRSPAIDAGNNIGGLAYDQRGAPYARASGPPETMSPIADIGAYEVNQLDVVFNANFEGCP